MDKFDEELEKRFNDTNFVDNVGANFYIDDVNETNEEAKGGGFNTPGYEAYGEMMVEASLDQYTIDKVAYNKYIGSKVIMDVP